MVKKDSNADQLIASILSGIDDVKGKEINILDLQIRDLTEVDSLNKNNLFDSMFDKSNETEITRLNNNNNNNSLTKYFDNYRRKHNLSKTAIATKLANYGMAMVDIATNMMDGIDNNDDSDISDNISYQIWNLQNDIKNHSSIVTFGTLQVYKPIALEHTNDFVLCFRALA